MTSQSSDTTGSSINFINEFESLSILHYAKYSVMTTDDLMKRIRAFLIKHGISQNFFGQNIGLSQSSLSRLFNNPMPWLKLGQKAREIFIRMDILMDDNDSIQKLISDHYKQKQASHSNFIFFKLNYSNYYVIIF